MSKLDYTFYVDGACSGNPGPMGCGIVATCELGDKQFSRDYSIPLGHGTNQKAELLAVKNALLKVPEDHRQRATVLIVTDSQYAIGCLSLGWNVKTNALIANDVKKLMAQFKNLKFKWVKGHEKDENNNRADALGVAATQSASEPTHVAFVGTRPEVGDITQAIEALTEFLSQNDIAQIITPDPELRQALIFLRSKLQKV